MYPLPLQMYPLQIDGARRMTGSCFRKMILEFLVFTTLISLGITTTANKRQA
jgi:hypothetical protein